EIASSLRLPGAAMPWMGTSFLSGRDILRKETAPHLNDASIASFEVRRPSQGRGAQRVARAEPALPIGRGRIVLLALVCAIRLAAALESPRTSRGCLWP